MSARLKSGLWVKALLRRAGQDGGSAMLLRRGDEDAGTVLVVLVDRAGRHAVLREAGMQEAAGSPWHRVEIADPAALQEYLDRQIRYDSDLWIIEIEVADLAAGPGDGPGEGPEALLGSRYAS